MSIPWSGRGNPKASLVFARQRRAAELQFAHDEPGKIHKRLFLCLRQGARHPVDHAKSAEVVTPRRPERRARVEANIGFVRDEGVRAEPVGTTAVESI